MKVISRLLLDTNVWMYYFMGTPDHLPAISRLIEMCVSADVDILYAPTSLKDVFYLIPRSFKREDAYTPTASTYLPAAWACAKRMMELGTAAPLSASECEMARMLQSQVSDLENGLVLAAADRAQADYVVTYDQGLLKAVPEECVTAERVLELIKMGKRA